MSRNHDTSKLDDLIVTTIDSVKGYEESAENAKSPRYEELFRQLAQERREIVSMLQAESRRIGGSPNDFGSAAATLHRRWQDLRAALGGGDEAVLKEIERGEDYLKEEFERALKDDGISPDTHGVIAECYGAVRRSHQRAGETKHMFEAAE